MSCHSVLGKFVVKPDFACSLDCNISGYRFIYFVHTFFFEGGASFFPRSFLKVGSSAQRFVQEFEKEVFFDSVVDLDGAFDASVLEGCPPCGIAKMFLLGPQIGLAGAPTRSLLLDYEGSLSPPPGRVGELR